MTILNRLQPMGLLALRVALAVIFVYHGYPKLVNPTPEMQFFFLEHGLPAYFVSVAGVLETFGGFLFLAGLFTRPVALLIAIEMMVAIWKVKTAKPIVEVKDVELEVVIIAACLALATMGAGLASLDVAVLKEGGRRRRSTDH